MMAMRARGCVMCCIYSAWGVILRLTFLAATAVASDAGAVDVGGAVAVAVALSAAGS